ncbi:GTSE1 [Branchiostoma lanceolatum]|uniref:GTSE1 protein n=1 Tax=Branchiostoma lanceolatum TaxID=7740 RepID=A0A8K0ESY7_BRALA|nr:GTSE1 [Branchiostoma lanceolatum]
MEMVLSVLKTHWEDFKRTAGLEFLVTEGVDLVLTCILVLFVLGIVIKSCLLLAKGCLAGFHFVRGTLTSPKVKRDILDETDHVNRVEDSIKDAGGVTSEDTPNEAKQNEVNNDKIEDAVGLLETEEFDFDIPVSPVNKEQEGETSVNEDNEDEDDDEVFFGPVGFREKVISKAKDIQEEEEKFVPLELNGDQYAELFVEATRLAKELEKESKRNREEEIKLAKSEARLFKKKAPQNSPRNSPRRMTYTLDTPEKEGSSSSTTTADAKDSNQRQQNNVDTKDGLSGLVPKRLGRLGVRNNTNTSNGSSRIGSGAGPQSSSGGDQKPGCSNNETVEKMATERGANGRKELIKPAMRKGTFTMSPNNASSNNSHATRNGSENNGAADAPTQPVKRRSGIPAPGSRGSSLPRSQIPRKGSAGMNTSMNRSISMESRMSRSQNRHNDSMNPSLGSLGRSFSNGSIDDSDDAASVTSDASDISTASAPAAVKRKGSVGSLPQNAKIVKTSAMPQRSGSLPKLSGRRRSNSTSSASRTSSTPSKGPSKKRVSGLQPPQAKPQLAKPSAAANTSFSKKSLIPGGGYGVPMPKKQQPMRATLPISQISTPKVNANSQVQSIPRTIPALTPRPSLPSASTPVVQDKKVVPKRISVDEQPSNNNRPLPAVPSTPQNSRIPSAASGSARRRSGIPTPRSMQRQSRLPPRGSAIPTPGSSRRSCLPTLAANDSPSEFPAPHLRKVQETSDSPLALRGSGPDNLPKALIDFGEEDVNSNSPPVANLIDI